MQHLLDQLMPGILYVSMEYGMVGLSWCWGREDEVVRPLAPTDWRITYDGETISLRPSVGSWSLPCRSRYVINRSQVIEAAPWTNDQIAAARRRDHLASNVTTGRKGTMWRRLWNQKWRSPKHSVC